MESQENDQKPFNFSELREWIVAIGTLAAVFVGIWAIFQNTENIKTAQKTFLSAVNPSLNLDFPINVANGKIIITNTSPDEVVNIQVFSVCYIVTGAKNEISLRSQSDPFPIEKNRLGAAKGKLEIPAKELMISCKFPNQPMALFDKEFSSIVIVYHRNVDNKRFVKIEPIFISNKDDGFFVSPVYADKTPSNWGNAQDRISLLKEIEQTERVLFRAEN